MPHPWHTIDSVSTEEGILELRQRGDQDFLITVGGRVLMNSRTHRTEVALGRLAGSHLRNQSGPRVLLGGLGMGYTLRAVLDTLPPAGKIVVSELNPRVLAWCRDPLAALTDRAAEDPRVSVKIGDVAQLIRRYAGDGKLQNFDAVVLDLYSGPCTGDHKRDDPFYGSAAIHATRDVLKPNGVLAVWGEDYDAGFDKRLRGAGFTVTSERLGRGGPRHVVYLGKLKPHNRRSVQGASKRSRKAGS